MGLSASCCRSRRLRHGPGHYNAYYCKFPAAFNQPFALNLSMIIWYEKNVCRKEQGCWVLTSLPTIDTLPRIAQQAHPSPFLPGGSPDVIIPPFLEPDFVQVDAGAFKHQWILLPVPPWLPRNQAYAGTP